MALPDSFSYKVARSVRLPGIVKIGFVRCSQCQANVVLRAVCGVPVYVPGGITWLDIEGFEASCQAVKAWKYGTIIETTELSFICSTALPDADDLAFVVIDGNEDWWLIGRRERPRTKVEVTATIGKPSGEPSAMSYKVTSVALRSLIKLSF